MTTKKTTSVPSRLANFTEIVVDRSRWLLVPAYLGLTVVVFMISVRFLVELWHALGAFWTMKESSLMLMSLTPVSYTHLTLPTN